MFPFNCSHFILCLFSFSSLLFWVAFNRAPYLFDYIYSLFKCMVFSLSAHSHSHKFSCWRNGCAFFLLMCGSVVEYSYHVHHPMCSSQIFIEWNVNVARQQHTHCSAYGIQFDRVFIYCFKSQTCDTMILWLGATVRIVCSNCYSCWFCCCCCSFCSDRLVSSRLVTSISISAGLFLLDCFFVSNKFPSKNFLVNAL